MGYIGEQLCRSSFLMKLSQDCAGIENYIEASAKNITFSYDVPFAMDQRRFVTQIHDFVSKVDDGKLGVLMVDRQSEFAAIRDKNGPEKTFFGYDAEPLPFTSNYASRQVMQEMTKWLEQAEQAGL